MGSRGDAVGDHAGHGGRDRPAASEDGGYGQARPSGGYGQAGSRVGERYARGEWQEHPRYGGWGEHRDEERWRSPDRDDRGLMDRMGDTLREGMEKLTGRGPKGYKRSDERIREDVCERLARSGRNAENVEVQVENGEVTLSGEVENRADKRHLEDMIEDVFGVDEVHNHLRLRRETPRSSAETSSSTSTRARDESDDAGLPH